MSELLLWLALQSPSPSLPVVRCEGRGAAAGRQFVLERPASAATWQLRYRDREHPRWITLTLPGADPAISAGMASLVFRNANGGRQVELDVKPGAARLDIFVDYGLDVNIDADLDPDVDRMNTEGPLADLSCQVTP
jgi:hypothetical protein